MTPNLHDCHYEEQIQGQSRKIERLEARADFKDKRLDNIDRKIEGMDKKMDELLEGFNQLKIQSNKEDSQLELRLKAIETELAANKEQVNDYRNRFTMILSVITIFFTALTFIFNFILH